MNNKEFFDFAFNTIITHEMGYVNDKNDPGGETKYGITKRYYPNEDIKNLSLERAKEIYYRDYWIKTSCHKLPKYIALCVFDSAVNQGVPTSIKMLQKALNVKVDGKIGPITRGKANKIEKTDFLIAFSSERINRYTKTKNYDKFGKGWIKRTISVTLEADNFFA